MSRLFCAFTVGMAWFVGFLNGAAADDPTTGGVVAGWDSNDGRVLLGELKCLACHDAGAAKAALSDKYAPNLSKVGRRVTPQYLRAYLANPHSIKPGTTMPDLLHGVPAGDRAEIVDALTHFLQSLGGSIDQQSSGASLSEIARGRDLFHSVGCVACHKPFDPPPKHKIDASIRTPLDEEDLPPARQPKTDSRPYVPLPPLAMKTTVDQLAQFLHNPLEVRPSGRMPSLSLKAGEGRSLAAYLLRDQFTADQTAPGSGVSISYYTGNFPLAVDLHKAKPVFEDQLTEISLPAALAMVEQKTGKKPSGNFGFRFYGLLEVPADGEYTFFTRSDDGSIVRVNGEIVVNNDGLHAPADKEGKVTLRRGRHEFDVAFTQGGGGFELTVMWQPPGQEKRTPIPSGVLLNQSASAMIPKGIVDFTIDPAKVERGREFFARYGCNRCHQTNNEAPPAPHAKPLAMLTGSGGCLVDNVDARLPRYDVSEAQRVALRAAISAAQDGFPVDSAEDQIRFTMTTLNCYGCHRRAGIGGPDEARKSYFVYDKIVDLGDEGRLPPPLHDVGAKLTKAGFHGMLFDGQKYRTYMATRMPQFGKANVGDLQPLLEKADANKFVARDPEFSAKLVDDGRFLIGKTALSCVNCHAWGGQRLPGAEGMDFLESPRRLKPAWFHGWLKDPQKMRPGTRMPTAWPRGKTFFAKVAGGDVDRQIDAIWAYLSVGEKGGFPAGLSPDDNNLLTPSESTIVFRTFLDQVSAHAITVGFRQRTHMAFDANRVRSVVAWTGEFIPTRPVWDGRAGQYAKIPSNNLLQLPDAPPFANLESLTAEWPKDVPKSQPGSTRTPAGWKFRGYRLGRDRSPTFRYEVGDRQVEETPGTEFLRDASLLRRTFAVSPSGSGNLYFLAATGNEIVAADGIYEVDGKVRVRISGTPAPQPFIRQSEGRQELVLPVVAKFTIDMMW